MLPGLDLIASALPGWKRSPACSALAVIFASVFFAGVATAQEPGPEGDADDSWIGPVEFEPGRGVSFEGIGLHIGGFTQVEFAAENSGDVSLELDGVNFLVNYEPVDFLRAFAELEIGDLLEIELNEGKAESGPSALFERLYGDAIFNDALNLRFGKFQTPVSRRNLVPAEPFVWTTTQPEILQATDEHQTGALLYGTFFPGQRTLHYWLYGQFVDPFEVESDEDPAERSAGGRIESVAPGEAYSIAASFLASRNGGEWSYLTGLDTQWHIGPHEINAEFIYADRAGRHQYGFYLEGAYRVIETLYLVSRYEYSDPVGSDTPVHLGDFGFVWTPRSYLHLRATYRVANEAPRDDERGLKASFVVLF